MKDYMTKTKPNFIQDMLIKLLILGASFLTIYYEGFVGSKVWAWFIAPTFNIRELTPIQMSGVFLFSTFFFIGKGLSDKELTASWKETPEQKQERESLSSIINAIRLLTVVINISILWAICYAFHFLTT